MNSWKWEGIDREGNKVSGSDDARSEIDLKRILRNKGIRPLKVRPPSLLDIDLQVFLTEHGLIAPFGSEDLLRFTKQFSVLINAGIPVLQGLEILYKQERNIVLRTTLKNVTQSVGGGKSIADSLSAQKGFDKLYCNLVRAGEVSGSLDTVLKKLVLYMEKSEKIKSEVKGALTYPVVVVVVGVAIIAMMLIFVVPQFLDMLKSTGQEIPFITQLVIDISFFLQKYILVMVFLAIVGGFAFKAFIKTKEGKEFWDRFVMNIPLFGNIVIKGNLASFSRTLGTMLSAGISLVDALDVCIRVIDSTVIATDLSDVKKQVEGGKTLASPLGKIKYFPDMVAQMIKVGEQTGSVDQMFDKIAEIFEKDVEDTVKQTTKLIEPLILVILGGVAAVVLIAMYMPIFMSAGGN